MPVTERKSDAYLVSLADILASAERCPGQLAVVIPPTWMQGRTGYGGLSVALAYEAAKSCADDFPPLASVQIDFIGPVAGRIEISAEIIRRGRSVAFVAAEIRAEDGALGLRATFVFAASLTSSGFADEAAPPQVRIPHGDALPALKKGTQDFRRNMELRFAAPPSETPTASVLRWVRLRDRSKVDPVVSLLALGDVLHPAALAVLRTATAVSTLNWMITLAEPDLPTHDGWWLIECRSNHFRHGLASQTISMWNSDGRLALHSSQGVAIFG